MITRFGSAPRLPRMSAGEFSAHWRTSHADAVRHLPGLRRYVQNHPLLIEGRPVFPYPGFDAASELDFDSVEAMEAAFGSVAYREAVAGCLLAFDPVVEEIAAGDPFRVDTKGSRHLSEGCFDFFSHIA